MSEYVCVMFPYPSGSGLHVGHYYNYAVMDSYCRWKRHMGEEVFQPFGYDSFGLPAENYARKIGGDVREITYSNIENFRRQMNVMNTSYEEKLVTSDPSYYKWSQWIFTKLLEHDLAYKKKGEVNYCNSCDTVLANEQVVNEECERCESSVTKKVLDQWYFRTTSYKDKLLAGLDDIDYPKGTIKQQRLWIENLNDWCVSRQRKWGTPIPIDGEEDTLDTFVDSSFYYLRYLTDSDDELIPLEDYKQVDLYVGGPEHACMHLIYARFIHMFLHDIGVVPTKEPFKKVVHQGMITKDGNKMSKSKGNAVNPDGYDQDEIRMYLMFLGPYRDGGDWSDSHIKGIRRFISRMKNWLGESSLEGEYIDGIPTLTQSIDSYNNNLKFNLIVSTLMSFYNKNKNTQLSIECARDIESILKCFCPSFIA